MKRAADILAACLEAQGMEEIFGVPGESYLAFLDAIHASDQLRFVNARHEGGACFMAEAIGKLTDRPGIACVTRGPGATNASIGVHTAMQNSTPLILFVGQIARNMREREAFQEIDYRAFFGPIAKWVTEIDDPTRMVELVQRAFHIAMSDRPGPVVIALPEDMLVEESNDAGIKRIERVEAGLNENDYEQIVMALKQASKPLVVAGGGGWNDQGRANLLKFAESNKIPVLTAFRCQDLIDNNSDCFVGDAALGKPDYVKSLLKEADLTIALNIRFGEIFTDGWGWATPPKYPTKLIHIHSDAAELGKIYQGEVHIHAGVNNAVAGLVRHTKNDFSEWCKKTKAGFVSSRKPLKTKGSVNVAEVCAQLNELIDDDAIFTNGAGNFAIYPGRYIRFGGQKRLIAPQSGAMGPGLPTAVALKIQNPNRQVICFAGDGDFQMSLQELGTAHQYGVGPIVFVHNNGTYGTIRMHQERDFPNRVSGTDLVNPDFQKIADAYGFAYQCLEKTEDLQDCFSKAKESKQGCIIEMITDPHDIAPGKILEV